MSFLIIVNWKMQKTYTESIKWVNANLERLAAILKQGLAPQDSVSQKKIDFVICPSFESIDKISNLLKNAGLSPEIKLGAQNCAAYERGAYTGEVSALSLKELNCKYVIVGHSERRIYFGEDNKLISQKINILFKNNIEPILSIGETIEEKNANKTTEVLQNQLADFFEIVKKYNQHNAIIAYEPVWSIGTNKIPEIYELKEIFQWLKKYIEKHCPHLLFKLIYGGSVNEKNVNKFKDIETLEGFLLGTSSLEFKILESILLFSKSGFKI